MRFVLLPSVLLLAACDGDQGLVVHNEDPTATFTAPQDGATVLEGRTVTLTGRVSDDNDRRSELVAGFEVEGRALCAKGPPAEGGEVRCDTTFPAGQTVVTLVVVDPNDATGQASITLDVLPTEAPVVTLAAPTADGTYYTDQPITLQGTVADAEDDDRGRDSASSRSDDDGGASCAASCLACCSFIFLRARLRAEALNAAGAGLAHIKDACRWHTRCNRS